MKGDYDKFKSNNDLDSLFASGLQIDIKAKQDLLNRVAALLEKPKWWKGVTDKEVLRKIEATNAQDELMKVAEQVIA